MKLEETNNSQSQDSIVYSSQNISTKRKKSRSLDKIMNRLKQDSKHNGDDFSFRQSDLEERNKTNINTRCSGSISNTPVSSRTSETEYTSSSNVRDFSPGKKRKMLEVVEWGIDPKKKKVTDSVGFNHFTNDHSERGFSSTPVTQSELKGKVGSADSFSEEGATLHKHKKHFHSLNMNNSIDKQCENKYNVLEGGFETDKLSHSKNKNEIVFLQEIKAKKKKIQDNHDLNFNFNDILSIKSDSADDSEINFPQKTKKAKLKEEKINYDSNNTIKFNNSHDKLYPDGIDSNMFGNELHLTGKKRKKKHRNNMVKSIFYDGEDKHDKEQKLVINNAHNCSLNDESKLTEKGNTESSEIQYSNDKLYPNEINMSVNEIHLTGKKRKKKHRNNMEKSTFYDGEDKHDKEQKFVINNGHDCSLNDESKLTEKSNTESSEVQYSDDKLYLNEINMSVNGHLTGKKRKKKHINNLDKAIVYDGEDKNIKEQKFVTHNEHNCSLTDDESKLTEKSNTEISELHDEVVIKSKTKRKIGKKNGLDQDHNSEQIENLLNTEILNLLKNDCDRKKKKKKHKKMLESFTTLDTSKSETELAFENVNSLSIGRTNSGLGTNSNSESDSTGKTKKKKMKHKKNKTNVGNHNLSDKESGFQDNEQCINNDVTLDDNTVNGSNLKISSVNKSSATNGDVLNSNKSTLNSNYDIDSDYFEEEDDGSDSYSFNKSVIEGSFKLHEKERSSVQDLKDLSIEIDFEVPPLHSIVDRSSRPTPSQKAQIAHLNLTIKAGKYTKSEDDQIRANWEKFCEVYEFCDNPELFFVMDKTVINKHQKQNFLKFLAQNLPERTTSSVYARFKRLYLAEKKKTGRFSIEEDEYIVKRVEELNYQRNYVCKIAKELNRPYFSVHSRLQVLKQTHTRKIRWGRQNLAAFIQNLMKITKVRDYRELKNRHITVKEFKKLSKKLDNLPVRILKPAWLGNIHSRLFIPGEVCELPLLKCKLIQMLCKNNEKDWRLVNWSEYAKHFDGFTSHKVYALFKSLTDVLPEYKRSNLEACLEILSEMKPDKMKSTAIYKVLYENGKVIDLRKKYVKKERKDTIKNSEEESTSDFYETVLRNKFLNYSFPEEERSDKIKLEEVDIKSENECDIPEL
ncbi:uncharacterized protein LOC115880619 isoform X2 [Sitophilus oryzae]|uniref:Uncharacterized protein LOC115880619 isoform X2 n=1 Tax=Sitophilus oryzae TaxID=7048 RepID=A0A6J2XT35_SITOR|nr:uncharacterized protein LOC115880619 isoform X2 [Sitophilus oryzae]